MMNFSKMTIMRKERKTNIGRPFIEVNLCKQSIMGEDVFEQWEITHVTKISEDRFNIEISLNLNSSIVIATSSENRGLMNTEKKDYSDFNNHVILFEKNKVISMNLEPTMFWKTWKR